MNSIPHHDRRSLESLATALARTATHLAAEPVPPAVWTRVLAQVEGPPVRAPRRRFSIGTRWRAWLGPSIATLAVSGVAALLFVAAPRGVLPPANEAAPMSGFLTLASADRLRALERAGGTTAWVVPTELRRADLASLGLPFDPSRAGDSIPAEVLVQATGEVIAVRLLPRHGTP